MKLEQDRILTALVGSYPKPRYLYKETGRKLLDDVGMSFFDLERELGAKKTRQLGQSGRRAQ